MTSMPNYPVRDLKMEAVTKLAIEDWNLPTPKNKSFEPVSLSLQANLSRVRLLMLLPTTISGATQFTQRAQDVAEHEITGSLASKAISPEVLGHIERRRIEILDTEKKDLEEVLGTPFGDKVATRHHVEVALALKGLAENPLAAAAFHELLHAHITGTWTAIESMFGDLWESALNCHPSILAALRGKPKRIGGSQPAATEPTRSDHDKSVPLNLIEASKFDIRSSMGTIFRRQRRFEFTRLSSAREAYSCAFSEKYGRVDAALNNKSFDVISAVRNVLVHRGGIADAEYHRYCSFLQIPKTAIGQPVLLDGEIVARVIQEAVASAKSLFIAVDDWIEQN